MKILHLIYSAAVSGAERYLQHLLPGLAGHGMECHLVVVTPKRTEEPFTIYVNEMNALGIKTTLVIAEKRSFILTAKKLKDYLKANDIKIVHSHLFNSDLIAAVLKMLFYRRVYLLSTKHGYQEKIYEQYEPGKKLRPNDMYWFITRFMLKRIDKNLAVSRAISNMYMDLGLTKTGYPFVHHGIKIEPFNKEDYREECRKADPQLIIVGRILPLKGHRFLIEAMVKVVEAFPGVKLLVLGEGSEKNHCIEKVNKLGLQKNIEFLGFKPHPYPFISHSDVIILPSAFEAFGLVYIEAFALKTPVVAFDTAAGNEIITNNETGLLVEKGNSKTLGDKIIYLLRNRE
ncbi:MAG TPA: glycosyltransferase family 4 protein, partial [Ferruginibacter sp.]|nr:glycosyltransferase family 4 protein [Ferruginibacter sp.]